MRNQVLYIPATMTRPYLDANFAPTRQETTVSNLPVVGELPQELSGWFVRNGPNPQFSPISPYHWFDGDGMLHSIKLANGKAAYRNRYIQTQAFCQEQSVGQAKWTGLLSPPQPDNPYGVGKNNANTALVYHHGKLLALWEGGEPYQIHPPSLKTLGAYDFDHDLTSAFTAHPKIDPVTGEMMFFGYSLAKAPYLYYGVVSARGKLLRTVPIDLPEPVMMHDFAITENYSIILDLPLVFSQERMQRGELPFRFEPSRPSRFGILPRHGDSSSIRWFSAPACYVLHTLNAYEEGDEVVLIAGKMDSINILSFSEMTASSRTTGSREDKTTLYEWRFNLRTHTVQEREISSHWIDFPRLNEQLTGRKMRYGYAAKRAENTPGAQSRFLFDGLVKYDFDADQVQTHAFGAERYGGEAVFVSSPQAKTEDEGWLLTFVYDTATQVSELVVLDAADITQPAIARVLLPQRVPYGFHGIWLARSQVLSTPSHL